MGGFSFAATVELKRERWLTFSIELPDEWDAELVGLYWPLPLLGLCHGCGVKNVYEAGFAALQYPPTWADSELEFAIIREATMEKLS